MLVQAQALVLGQPRTGQAVNNWTLLGMMG